jgi:ABC-type nitrate/sulfonate/bicarbonate transport system substrate-binding protein
MNLVPLTLAILLAGTAIVGPVFAPPAAAQDTSVPIAVSSSSLAYGGLQIAIQDGLFQKHGLDPKVIVMDSGNAAISAVVAGSAVFSGAGASEVLTARLRGVDIVIVANLYRGLSGSVVLAKSVAAKLGMLPSAPVDQRLHALNGLAIASPSATSAYTIPYRSAALAAGAKINFVYMSQPAMVAALQAGAVQGISAGAPFSLTPTLNGDGVLWISGPRGELPPADQLTSSACLQTSLEYAKAHPDTMRRLRAVFEDLAAFIKTKPDEAKAMLGKAYPQLTPQLLDAAFAESAANWAQPRMTPADIQQEIKVQVGAGMLAGVEKLDPAAALLPWPDGK